MDFLEYNGRTYEFNTVREWNNLKVVEADIPVKGCASLWDESAGEYRIFINKNLPDQEKLEVFLHEMVHIYRGDFENEDISLQQIEARCHQETKKMMEKTG